MITENGKKDLNSR